MQMLQYDWLSHCTLSAIGVQCLSVVNKIEMFPCLSELWKLLFFKQMDYQIPEKT